MAQTTAFLVHWQLTAAAVALPAVELYAVLMLQPGKQIHCIHLVLLVFNAATSPIIYAAALHCITDHC
jgi:hypothetical protein